MEQLFALAARSVKLDVPAEVGVPLMRPELVFNVSPEGNDPVGIDHVHVCAGTLVPLKVAVMACEYAVPTVPAGSDAGAMETVLHEITTV